jgi:hypothetical protein
MIGFPASPISHCVFLSSDCALTRGEIAVNRGRSINRREQIQATCAERLAWERTLALPSAELHMTVA